MKYIYVLSNIHYLPWNPRIEIRYSQPPLHNSLHVSSKVKGPRLNGFQEYPLSILRWKLPQAEGGRKGKLN